MDKKIIRAALLGFGTVGTGVYKVLQKQKEDMIPKLGSQIEIKKILVRNLEKAAAKVEDPAVLTNNWDEIVNDPEIDIVIELIGGIEPARSYILAALNAGKHAVTANKDLIAVHGKELLDAAEANHVDFLFEAAVAGGIPIIRPLKECLAGNHMAEVMGIVNGTTNFILTKMTQDGMEFKDALALATELGYAEADPTADIEGLDAGRKVAILASVAFNSRVVFDDVYIEGITKITAKDIKYAKEMGCDIKLLGVAKNTEEGIEAYVCPMLIPSSHPLASVNDSYNAVFVNGDAVENAMFYGRGVASDQPLSDLAFAFEEENPMVQWLKDHEEPIIYHDFRYSVEYKSMWEEEKHQLDKNHTRYCAGLKDGDNLAGVILITSSSSKKRLAYDEVEIISNITSVASIAIKNAKLYENARLEARTDELTGLLNRKYFYEVLNEEFEKNRDASLVLAIINVDDFKLYNQLYGIKEGDMCLQRVADIINSSVGESGYTARYGAKEFAVLLPGYDLFSARNLVESIAKQIYVMNNCRTDMKLKPITVSAGISAAPYAAKNVKELLENVDLAVYHVIHSGKNGIQVFDTMFRNNNKDAHAKTHAHIYKEYESTIYALTAAIDAKDHYTFSHSTNVAYYATALARTLGMNEDMIEIIHQAALLHDVGKIGIPESVLNKAGSLTDEEYEMIKGHVEASIDIIRHLPSLDYVIPAVIGHHERYDGKGYPRRIAGEDIPLTARILCVADSFDAMTSIRCYKKAFPVKVAREKLIQDAGKQFDPELVRKFVECLDNGTINLVKAEEA